MSNRDRWEFGAIPLTIVVLGALGVVLWAATQGLWVWVAVGVVALVALIVLAIAYARRPHHPPAPATPSRPEGAPAPRDDGVTRALVIVDAACEPADLAAALAAQGADRRTAAFVVAPALGSRTARWTGDEHAYQEATTRLDATLEALATLNVEASGHVGSHDPLQAAEDGLREFPADEIIFAVHSAQESNWLERGVVEDARARYPLPVRSLVVARSG
jgi:hypothetical protein